MRVKAEKETTPDDTYGAHRDLSTAASEATASAAPITGATTQDGKYIP